VGLEHFKCLLDQVAEDQTFTLRVLDFVAEVFVALFEKIHNGQDLSVVRDQCLSNGVTAGDE
jgi:hypothetical protein